MKKISTSIRSRHALFLLILISCCLCSRANAQTPVTIEINGLDTAMETNVRLFLSIEQQKNHPLITAGRLRRLHRKAPQEISAALQPFGYYRPQIETSLSKSDSGEWLAVYNINPGPPLPITEFKFNISAVMGRDEAFEELLQNESLKVGDAFNHQQYETFKADLAKLAAQRGYFDASYAEHRVEVDLDQYAARIYLDYEGGPRYRFGEVVLRQDVLDNGLMQRLIPFDQGDFYTLDKLIELQQVLNDTDYFQTADVSAGKPGPNIAEVPIEVSLTPRKRHRYETGLGYGTDTGARARFSWLMPRVNKQGHRFTGDLEVSEIGYSALASYKIPVLNPRTDQLIFSIGEEREEFEDTDSTVRSVGVSLAHSRGEWRENIAIKYQQEKFESGDDSGNSTLLIPGIGWSRTWGDGFINVLDGLRFDLGLRGASKDLVSDTSFQQLQASLKFISSLNSRNRIIARGSFGTTASSGFAKLPSSVRFFAGGAQSVRGYRYQSLGPTDDDGEVIGGRNLMVGSIEYEYYFDDRWGAAIFFDAGNAINDLDEDLEEGAGFGVRWKSPIGAIRFDLASAISREGKPWRLHISIGPDL